METKPKFYNKNGSLTIYSFACGYMETRDIDSNNRASLSLDGCWHVKGFLRGIHFWETFDKLTDARRFFRNCLK